MYSAGTLSKLHLQNLPILGGDNPTAGEVAMHTLMLERWAAAHNLKAYIMGPLPDDPDATLTRDGLRILMSSVSSGSLRGALCDIDNLSDAPTAWQHIIDNWLAGKTRSEALWQRAENMQYDKSKSLMAFVSELTLILRHVTPHMPAPRACELFAQRLPKEYDPFILAADRDPGQQSVRRQTAAGEVVEDVRSFKAYADAIVRLVQTHEARQSAREKLNPELYNPDALTTAVSRFVPPAPPPPPSIVPVPSDDAEDDDRDMAGLLDALSTFVRQRDQHRFNSNPNGKNGSYNGKTGGIPHARTARFSPSDAYAQGGSGTGPTKPLLCHCCLGEGHMADECPNPPPVPCDHPVCVLRDSTKHHEQACPHKHPERVANPKLRARFEMDNKLYFGGIAAGQTSRQPAHATTASDIDFDSMTFGVDKQEIELDMENYSCFCTTFHADHQVCTAELSPLIPEHEH